MENEFDIEKIDPETNILEYGEQEFVRRANIEGHRDKKLNFYPSGVTPGHIESKRPSDPLRTEPSGRKKVVDKNGIERWEPL